MLGRLTPAFAGLAILLAAGEASAARKPPPPPFDCAGPFTQKTSHAALARHFGARNVVFKTIPAPEGETVKATVVFQHDAARRVEIVWLDEARRRRPAQISVSSKGPWRTPEGLAVGSRLQAVEAANGKPFLLYGFGWDYGGTTIGWEDGKLQHRPCRLLLRFQPREGAYPEELEGERELRSDLEAMRTADPEVYEMILMWD